ncbi:MAG TPA: outer membrane lipoprotein-sorting protein, partial [Polyangia bacterium]|nr:outer membrane lipoprotein-sorting protein [Polyangia bacterium]
MRMFRFLAALGLILAFFAPRMAAALGKAELVEILKVVDERQRNQGDWRSLVYMEQKEKDKVDVAYEALVFRRSQDQRFMILFSKPKASQGQGYLRIDKNLWFYDPSVGKWERRTERERIGGTNSRRSDFDESRLA